MSDGSVRIEPSAKRVRAYLGGELIVDSRSPRLVWEHRYYPAYYFPEAEVRTELFERTEHTTTSPDLGTAVHSTVKGGTAVATNAAWSYPESPIEDLQGLVRIEWEAMDAWFEEDEEVFVHPRSPYTRVDVLESSRIVRVEIDGTVIAETSRPKILLETGLPPRYYLPQTDVRMDLLEPTHLATACPYKGNARWWSVRTDGERHEDIAWSYPTPLPESIKVAGLVCFYNERVDVFVDGERQERPRTHFA